MRSRLYSRGYRLLRAAQLCLAVIPSMAFPAVKPAPHAMQAAVLVKLLVFHKQIAVLDSVTVYVAGSPEFASALKNAIGTAIGSAVLAHVVEGKGTPSRRPHAVYVGDSARAGDLVAYTRENDVLSMTGVPGLMEQGVTLGVGVEDEKLKVYFNAEGSKEEGAAWEAGLFKVIEAQK